MRSRWPRRSSVMPPDRPTPAPPPRSPPAAAAPARRQRARRHLPAPRSGRAAGDVHPRLAAEPEHVLRLQHRQPRRRRERQADHRPPRLGLLDAAGGDLRRRGARRGAQRLPPAAQRVVVVRARVDDAVLLVVLEPVRAVRVVGIEAELHDDHPREAERATHPRPPASVMTPRSSAITGSAPSGAAAASNTARPGPRRQRRAARVGRILRHRPVRDEPRNGRSARGRTARTSAAGARSTSVAPVRCRAGQS